MSVRFGFFAILALMAGSQAFAGNLTPPSGAPVSTMKTIAEAEPRMAIGQTSIPLSITSSGSYYLTENISFSVLNSDCISIDASNVVLDLNGFTITGPGNAVGSSGSGIRVPFAQIGVTVRNGTVRQFRSVGFNLSNSSGNNIENVVAESNGASGIATGAHSTIANSRAISNLHYGFGFSMGTTALNCTASGNTNVGYNVSISCSLTNCTASGNLAAGFASAAYSSFQNCSATGNSVSGISCSTGNTITGCNASDNNGHGFDVGGASKLTNCTAFSNNSGNGFVLAGGVSIEGCNATGNSGHGISTQTNTHILNNVCSQNGAGAGTGSGIFASSSGNFIIGNFVTSNDNAGVSIASGGNVVIQNRASNNTGGTGTPTTNYSLAAANHYGAIINTVAMGAGFSNANTAANYEF